MPDRESVSSEGRRRPRDAMDVAKPYMVVAKRPFSPTVHLGAKDDRQEVTEQVHDGEQLDLPKSAPSSGYHSVPVSLHPDRVPAEQNHFKVQKLVVSLEKKKSSTKKPKSSGARPLQVSYSVDKDKLEQQKRERERLRMVSKRREEEEEAARRAAQKRKARPPAVAEHGVQTETPRGPGPGSSLDRRQDQQKRASTSTKTHHQVPPFPSSSDKRKRPSSAGAGAGEKEKLSLSKGGITVFKQRSHRPQPFFKKAAAAAAASSSSSAGVDRAATRSPTTILAPLAPKRLPMAPKIALRELAKEKELLEKRAEDEVKRKQAVAGLLRRVREDIAKSHQRRRDDLESKCKESTERVSAVSALLREAGTGKQRAPLKPKSLNEPRQEARRTSARAASGSKARVPAAKKNSEKTLEELLDETVAEGEPSRAQKKERDYPKPWQKAMKRREPSEAEQTGDGQVAEQGGQAKESKAGASSSVRGDLYDILGEPEVSGVAGETDPKRAEVLEFMRKKRAEVAKALKEESDREEEKRLLMRTVHREYGEHSKQMAKDLATHHKDFIAKTEKKLKERPGWVFDFAGVPYEDDEREESGEEDGGPAPEAAAEEAAAKEAEAPKPRQVKLVKIPKKPRRTSAAPKAALAGTAIKSTVKALATPPKPTKKKKALAAVKARAVAEIGRVKPGRAADASEDEEDVVAAEDVETEVAVPTKKAVKKKKKAALSKAKAAAALGGKPKPKKAKAGGKAQGKKLDKMQQEINELKGIATLGESAMLAKLNEVAQRLHSKLQALEEGDGAQEDDATREDLVEMSRELDQAVSDYDSEFAFSPHITPLSSRMSSPARLSPRGSPLGGLAAAAREEEERDLDALQEDLALAAEREAEEAMLATEALHQQLQGATTFDSDSPTQSPRSARSPLWSPARSLSPSGSIEESISGVMSPKERVEADLVTNVVSLLVPSDQEVRSPTHSARHTPAKSPMASPLAAGGSSSRKTTPRKQTPGKAKSPSRSARKIEFDDAAATASKKKSPFGDGLGDGHFDLPAHGSLGGGRAVTRREDDASADVLPTGADEFSIIDVYAKKNASPPKPEGGEPPEAAAAAEAAAEQPEAPEEPESPIKAVQDAVLASPKPALSPSAISLSVAEAVAKPVEISIEVPSLPAAPPRVQLEDGSSQTPPQAAAAETSPEEAARKPRSRTPSPGKKEQQKRVKIPSQATALAGQLKAELARFTSLSDMTDHLTKLEQKIEVVQLMKESTGQADDSAKQIKDMMAGIYEQQRDLTEEMKQAIATQSSAFVEKLRDTAAVQGNFYTETLKYTAKEMAEIMSKESTKSLEQICATFEEKLGEYASIQRQMKDSLETATKSVESLSRQQSPVQTAPPRSPMLLPTLSASGLHDGEHSHQSIVPEYTQDFESEVEVSQVSIKGVGGGGASAHSSPRRSSGASRAAGGTDSEAVSEVEEQIFAAATPTAAAARGGEDDGGEVTEEILEDVEDVEMEESVVELEESVVEMEESLAQVDTEMDDGEMMVSEAAASVTEEVEEIEAEEEEEVEEGEEGKAGSESFHSSTGLVVSLELPGGEEEEEILEEEEVVEEEIAEEISFPVEEEIEEEVEATRQEASLPPIPGAFSVADGDEEEEDISDFIFADNKAAEEEADLAAAEPEQPEPRPAPSEEEEGQGMININDFGYSMRYVDKVLERLDLTDVLRSLEEESDPIPTDHFFKIEEEATILSDPEYIYHKLIFDAVNEVLLNRINDGPTTTTRGDLDLESAKAEVKLRVGAMVKFGLRNFDAGQELEKIHELETEDEIKVFGELESFFRDTRQELVDGVLDHVLGDTVRVLGVLEMMETTGTTEGGAG